MKNTSSYISIAAMAVATLLVSGCASTAPETTSPPVGSVPPLAAAQPAPAVQPVSAPASANMPKLKFVKADSEETSAEDGKGANAVDGDTATIWHTQWQDTNPPCPHEIVIELVPPTTIKGFTYLPRQDDVENGTIKDYEFYVSDDGNDFGQPVSKGTFENSKDKKTAAFAPKSARFIKLKALSEVNDAAWTSAAEIGVVPVN